MHENYDIDDRILLKKAAKDDCSQSLAVIYEKYAPALTVTLRKIGAGKMAEDICQTVFLKIAQRKCLYDGSSDVQSFFFGVGRNTFYQELRKQSREKQVISMQIDDDNLLEEIIDETKADPLEFVEYRQFLYEKIALLPTKTRHAIKLVYIEGFSASKAAFLIDCDPKTFRKRLHYGLMILKKDLTLKQYKSLINKTLLILINFF
ncbi:MAG: RNA polymerase sigma factor [Phycisphaerae bacterium]|nr:RNA polymerase sigma factor [Phycisphaerae bacterium]